MIELGLDGGRSDDLVEVVEIRVSVGDRVAVGDVLLVVETDKADVEIVAPVAGTVEALPIDEGDEVAGDAVLAILRASEV